MTTHTRIISLSGIAFLASCKQPQKTDAASQYSGGGVAEYVFFKCEATARTTKGEYRFETSPLNNTSQEVSLQLSNSSFPMIEFFILKKSATDQWNMKDIKIRLANNKNGSKGITVTDTHAGLSIPVENSKCKTLCAGPTTYSNGHCLWSGITEESVIGNLIIDTISTAGIGGVWRLAIAGKTGLLQAGKSATALVSDRSLRTGAELIARSKNYDESMVQLAKSIEKTNPLTGTAIVENGNCANDAMTQLVALVLGRWACAIPYPQGKPLYASVETIVNNLRALVGIRSSYTGIKNLSEFAGSRLAKEMADGDVAFVLSGSENAGHATLITRIKGRFVHINNQNWPQKFQTIPEWEKTWQTSYGQNGAVYHVYIVAKKMIGFGSKRFF